jgi:hypothetical protein
VFITELTRALYLSLFWARPVQLTPPHPNCARSSLMSYTHLCPGLPSGLFPSGFLTNNQFALLFYPIRTICLAHLILLHLIILIIPDEEYKSCSSSLFGPNIPHNTLFLNTLSLCYSLIVRDNVSHPYRTTGKIIVLYILIFIFFDSRRGSGLNDNKYYQNSISP